MLVRIQNEKYQEEKLISLEIFIEKQLGQYNNLLYSSEYNWPENLTNDEIKTFCYMEAIRQANRVFNQIEPTNEEEVLENFSTIPSRTVGIRLDIPTSTLTAGGSFHYNIYLIDQYGNESFHEQRLCEDVKVGQNSLLVEVNGIETEISFEGQVDRIKELEGLVADLAELLLGGE